MTQTIPIRNPVLWSQIEPELTAAEQHFAYCMARGDSCVLSEERPKPDGGNDKNTVRGDVIRFFAFGGDERHQILGPKLHLEGAWISGQLDLSNAHIPYALGLCSCHIAETVAMLHMECPTISMSKSLLGGGLFGDGLVTTGSVRLNHGFGAAGLGVRLINANIGGSLICTDAVFGNHDGGMALAADQMIVGGSVYLGHRFMAENKEHHTGIETPPPFFADGEVRMSGARIGGNLDCAGGVFMNKGKCAIKADGVQIGGTFFMSDNFVADGSVVIIGARIADFTCENATLNGGMNSWALVAERAEIQGGINWHRVQGKGEVNFGSVNASALSDDEESWGKFEFLLDEFNYGKFVGDKISTDADSRLKWLGSRPQRLDFSPQPYERAASVLFAMGHGSDARKILLKKERLQTADKRMPWPRKIGRKLWDVFTGYGYRLSRTVSWMAGFVILGAFIFSFADKSGCIVPNRPVVLANFAYNNAVEKTDREDKCPDVADRPTSVVKRLFPDYPEFNAFVYSLDVFIPVFALHQEPNWHPKTCPGRGLTMSFLSWWHWLEIIAGWILTSLLLLSATGLLRPRQSSGEKG